MSRIFWAMTFTGAIALPLAALAGATPALAQGKGSPFGGMSVEPADKDEFRSFILSTPIANFNGETIVHMELNLAGNATLALEGIMKRAFEEVDEKEMEETGESRSSKAKGGALILSRYSRPMSMAGFYWSIGAGYRQEDVTWSVRPDEQDPDASQSFGLVDEKGNLHHDARLSGMTGNFRGGYRYVGKDFPFLGGIYLGARHFQAGVEDNEVKRDEPVRVASMTDREKERLRRKYSTRPEFGLEVGFRF